MSLANVPQIEAMKLWGELVEAYHGANRYGGDTAELYAYRFMRFLPTTANRAGALTEDHYYREESKRAAAALHELLAFFAEAFGCDISVDGKPLGPWVAFMDFTHRAHVCVLQENRRDP